MFFKSTAVVALLASFVAAQVTVNDTLSFAASSVDLTTRSQWCTAEINTCGTLCSGTPANNTCDPTTLNFSCTCASNNSAPGLQYYENTLPTFICENNYAICKNDTAGDAAAQEVCNTEEAANCGHLDPTKFAPTAATTSSASTATSATAASTSPSGTASSSSSKAAGATMAPITNMRNLGSGALAVGLAAMGFML